MSIDIWPLSDWNSMPRTIDQGNTRRCGFLLNCPLLLTPTRHKSVIGHGYKDTGFIIADIQTKITAPVVILNSWYRGTASLFICSASSNSPLYIVKHTHYVDSSMSENMCQTYVLCKRNKSSKLVSYLPVSRQCRQFMLCEIISQEVKLLHNNK